jgi:TatD DNase family protein
MLLDAHAHLDRYGERLESALEEIRRLGILTFAVSMDVPSYEHSAEIEAACELVIATFGVHPSRAFEYAGRLSGLAPLIEQSPALGEVGLDFHWVRDPSRYPAQRKVLEYFLAAAREQRKLVNLHTKGAEKEVLDLLDRYSIERAIVHWYSGPLDVLRAFVEFGAYFTVGVELLRSEHIRAVARAVPLERLLTETDNPGGWRWLTGETAMPGIVRDVVQALAGIRGLDYSEMAEVLESNFKRLARSDPWLSPLCDRWL